MAQVLVLRQGPCRTWHLFKYLERVKYLIPCPHLLRLNNVMRDGPIIIPLLSSNVPKLVGKLLVPMTPQNNHWYTYLIVVINKVSKEWGSRSQWDCATSSHEVVSLKRELIPVLLRSSIRERVAKRARFRVSSGRHSHTSELTAGAATKKRPSQCRGRRCCPWASFRPWFSSWGHRSSSSTRPSMARYVYPIPAYFHPMTERRFGERDVGSYREGAIRLQRIHYVRFWMLSLRWWFRGIVCSRSIQDTMHGTGLWTRGMRGWKKSMRNLNK